MAPRIFVDAMKYLYVFNIKQHSITKLINFSIQSKQILVLKHKKQNGLGVVEASQTQIEHTSNVAKLINVPQRALRKCFKSILPSPPRADLRGTRDCKSSARDLQRNKFPPEKQRALSANSSNELSCEKIT